MLSICDRAFDSRDKKREKELSERIAEDETLGELTSHFKPPQCSEGDCTTTLRWLVVGAEVSDSQGISVSVSMRTNVNWTLPSLFRVISIFLKCDTNKSFHNFRKSVPKVYSLSFVHFFVAQLSLKLRIK